MKTMQVAFAFVLSLVSICAMAEIRRLDEIYLSSSQEIEVGEGDTLEIGILGGNSLLTKKGLGTLKIYCVAAGEVRIAVHEGRLAFGLEELPLAASNAWFRVDASDLSTMTIVEQNGTNFVTRWNDANGGSRYAIPCETTKTWRSNPDERLPFLRQGFQNGRNVVDFGSYLRSELKNQGRYGAAMHWSEACENVREAFIVVSDTEDLKGLSSDLPGPFLLGHSDEYNFHRGMLYNGDAALVYEYNSHTANLRNENWRLDGRPISSPVSATLPAGFHVVNMRANSNVKASAFAHDREISYGGQRIAECLIFESELSEADRNRTQAYLSMKWRPAPIASLSMADGTSLDLGRGARLDVGLLSVSGTTTLTRDGTTVSVLSDKSVENVLISFDEEVNADDVVPGSRCIFLADARISVSGTVNLDGIVADGEFCKDGSGNLVVCRAMDSRDVSVVGGSLTVSPLQSKHSFFHTDASDISSMEIKSENGTNFVTRWNDAVGGGRYAVASTYTSNWRPSPELRCPFLRKNSFNDLYMVDFGPYLTKDVADGYGAAMDWSDTCTGIREVFLVAADTEDLINLRQRYGNKDINGPFLMGHTGDFYNFHRELLWNNGHPVFLKSNAAAGLKNGVCWLDWRTVTPTSAAFPDNNLHVLNFQTTAGVTANAFARDRKIAFGGIRIAECIVFTSPADILESERLRKQLLVKWLAFSDDYVYNYTYRNLTVAAGCTARFPYAGVESSGMLSIGGEIDAVRVAANSILLSSLSASVTGALVIPETGTISLSLDDFKNVQCNVPVKIISAGSVSRLGKLSDWSVGGNVIDRYKVLLSAESDGIYATFRPRGFTITVR